MKAKRKNFSPLILKKKRIQAGLTQDYMSKKLGFKTSAPYCKIENGKQRATAEMLSQIALELHCAIDDLYC